MSDFRRSLSPTRRVGLLLVGLAAWALYLTHELPVVQRGAVGPGAFPLSLAVALLVCGLWMCIRPPAECDTPKPSHGAWVLLGTTLAVPVLLGTVGSFLAFAVCGSLLFRFTTRSWWQGLAWGSVASVGLHLLIMGALRTPLPWWIP
jgi:hypothetical protein